VEGDVIGRMRLDIADVQNKLGRVEAMMKGTMDGIAKQSAKASQKIIKDTKNVMHVSRGAARTWSLEWWKRFGEIAVGFGIAYRAIRAMEAGVRKVIDTYSEAIRESSDLAAVQAKLAFWYQMHTKESLKYTEVFERASLNIQALGEASVYSVATLDELTTGIDELAQSVGAIPAKMIPAMASMVDFTVMVAQTTGSTTRQVRQEFQALMEGRIRTTDVMARSLIKTGILTRAELKQMRDMTNQAEILEKVMGAVHERWSEARDIYREASIEAAKGFWEKALKMNIRLSVDLASELTKTGKIAGNLFAKVFVEHGKRALDDMEKGIYNNVLTMMALRSILDKVLTAYEKTLAGISWFIAGLYRMSDELIIAAKALGGLLMVSIVTKLMTSLGKIMIWLVVGPFNMLHKAVLILNAHILRIPLGLYASIVAIQAFFKTIGMSGAYLKDIFLAIPELLFGIFSTLSSESKAFFSFIGDQIWSVIPKPVRKIIEWIVEEIEKASAVIKAKVKDIAEGFAPAAKKLETKILGFFAEFRKRIGEYDYVFAEEFGKNFKEIFLGHIKFLEDAIAPFWSMLSDDNKANYKKMLTDAEAYVEGLGWLFKEGREETEKERKKREQKERQHLKLMSQMQKDYLVGNFVRFKANADAEYEIRLRKISEIADLEKRSTFEAAANKAYHAKIDLNMLNTLKYHTESYYAWKKTEIEKDTEAMIAAGSKRADAEKWALDELKKLNIEHNQFIIENSNSLIETTSAAWANFIMNSKSMVQQFAETSLELMKTFAQGVGNTFAQTLIYGENLVAGLQNLAQQIASTIISTLIQVTVEKAIQWALGKALDATEAASRLGVLAAETYAGAFASTVAIPVVGPAMAPGVAAASLATMLAGAAGAGSLGSALGATLGSFDEGGISNVPGLYYAGVPEAHVPLESGNIPVKLDEKRTMTQVDIVNVFDPVMFDQYLASSRGRDAIVNVIGVKSQSVRRVLR
jgi:hypothetical protein